MICIYTIDRSAALAIQNAAKHEPQVFQFSNIEVITKVDHSIWLRELHSNYRYRARLVLLDYSSDFLWVEKSFEESIE